MLVKVRPILLALLAVIILILGSRYRNQLPSSPSSPIYIDPKYSWNVEVLLTGLDIPWDLAILPDNNLLITERTGKVKRWDGQTVSVIAEIPVAIVSESGLTGIALHPKFADNHWVYLYYTYRKGGELMNKVVRYQYLNNGLREDKVILDNLAGGQIHNGGRLRFGPDGKLYVLTGDGARPEHAQDLKRLEGKVLRMNDDGSVPSDNPFTGLLIYSYGHRNPQGLTWHTLTEQLIATEHGETAYDEVNLIEPGHNYGWPKAKKGPLDHQDYTAPILSSGEETWAPSGIDFAGLKIWALRNTAMFAGLRSKKLQAIEIEDGKVKNQIVVIDGQYGRLRAVLARGDGAFYVTTSNRDGRTIPLPGDDKLLLVHPVPK